MGKSVRRSAWPCLGSHPIKDKMRGIDNILCMYAAAYYLGKWVRGLVICKCSCLLCTDTETARLLLHMNSEHMSVKNLETALDFSSRS